VTIQAGFGSDGIEQPALFVLVDECEPDGENLEINTGNWKAKVTLEVRTSVNETSREDAAELMGNAADEFFRNDFLEKVNNASSNINAYRIDAGGRKRNIEDASRVENQTGYLYVEMK